MPSWTAIMSSMSWGGAPAAASRGLPVRFDVAPPERTQLRKPTESPWYWSW